MSAAPPGTATTAEPALGSCLVTGGSGFLGSALVARLQGLELPVRTLGRRAAMASADHLRLDLAREELPAAACAGIDTVFHLAALTHAEADAAGEAAYAALNVEGTGRVVRAALAAGVRRLIFVSSAKVYGEGGEERIEEDAPPRPTTPYGRSKLAAERLVLAAGDRLHACCLRLPLVYGPGQKGNLQRMIAGIDRGLFPPPPRNGNRRSMVHVETVVDALLLVAADARAAGRTYLIADPEPYATRDLYDWLRAALGRAPARWSAPMALLRVLARGGDVAARLLRRRVPFDSAALAKLTGSAWYGGEQIAQELGFRPRRMLREVVPLLVAEHRGARRERP
jgi:nucleoside-diphosphate-sugar epimerase